MQQWTISYIDLDIKDIIMFDKQILYLIFLFNRKILVLCRSRGKTPQFWTVRFKLGFQNINRINFIATNKISTFKMNVTACWTVDFYTNTLLYRGEFYSHSNYMDEKIINEVHVWLISWTNNRLLPIKSQTSHILVRLTKSTSHPRLIHDYW